ncbi:MAG: DNA primase [Rickettsiales bacterium]|jgi:DNA primase|nr:DNA primase [Rickettsiales bacterium]
MRDSNFLNLLKSKVTLSDVIGKSVRLIQRGKNKIARCPFHSEKTPSFQVNDEKGFYHCFGCGVHGDVFDFMMQKEGLSLNEAMKILADENGLELPVPSRQAEEKYRKTTEEFDIIYNINEKSCVFFQNCLLSPGGAVGLDYIRKRGLSSADIERFRIGFAPNSYGQLINHLRDLGFSEDRMIMAGVVARNERSAYDKFRNRVIFPVFGDSGRVIAFSGRVLEKDALPKYMNSPETQLYHKGDVLFNYFFARKSIIASKYAILVEGNMDALSLYSRGIENVVSPMGTAATQQQMEKLWKIAEEIVVCFDGDLAGQKASKRLALLVLPIMRADRSLRIVSMPENTDPDDMIRLFGKEYFLKYLEDKKNSMVLSEFLWTSELRDVGLSMESLTIIPEQKNRLETILNRITEEIGNGIVQKNFRNFYRNKLFRLGRSENSSRPKYGSGQAVSYRTITNLDPRKSTVPPNSVENLKNSMVNIEKYMFYVLIGNVGLVEKIFQNYNVDVFAINFLSCDAAGVVSALSEASGQNRAGDKSFVYTILEKNGLKDYITGSLRFRENSTENNLEYLYSLILERNALLLEIEIRELALRNDNEDRRKVLSVELETLNEQRNALNSKFIQ